MHSTYPPCSFFIALVPICHPLTLSSRLDKCPIDYIHTAFNLNALFPTLLTRALLPHLRRTAASGPVLVQFTGSIASEIAPPRLPIYAASKGFVKALSRGLDNDELFFGAPTGVRVSYLSVGSVRSSCQSSALQIFTSPS